MVVAAGGGDLDAAYERARALARRIVAGAVSPYEGATTIWKEVVDRLGPPVPDDLWPFKSNASAIATYADYREAVGRLWPLPKGRG